MSYYKKEEMHAINELISCFFVHYPPSMLTNRMQTLGYRVEGGLCAGVAGVGMQALLLGDDAIIECEQHFQDAFTLSIAGFEEEVKQTSSNPQSTAQELHGFRKLMPFFDSIHVYQGYAYFMEQHESQSAVLFAGFMLCKALQEQGNLVLCHHNMNTYSFEDLLAYIEQLKNIQMKYSKHHLAIQLRNGGHALVLGYSSVKKTWTFLDVLYSSFLTELNDSQVAERIFASFSPNKKEDFNLFSALERRLVTDLSALAARLPSFSFRQGVSDFYYDAKKKCFFLVNPKENNVAIFKTEIYGLGSMQNRLQTKLQCLIVEWTNRPELQVLDVKIKHLDHQVQIIYDREKSIWMFLDEERAIRGQTKKLKQITLWIMSEFLASTYSITTLKIHSNLKPNEISSIADVSMNILERACHSLQQNVFTLELEKVAQHDTCGYSLLFLAAAYGDAKLVQRLLDLNADPNEVFIHHNQADCALIVSARQGHFEVINVLLRYTLKEQDVNVALVEAARHGCVRCVELLLPISSNKNHRMVLQSNDFSALMSASCNGHTEVVSLLLRHGVAIDLVNDIGRTALFLAVRFNHRNIIQVLVEEYKADLNTVDKQGVTPLFLAVCKQDQNLMNYLIHHGAEVNKGSIPPLCIAAENGDIESAKLLLSYAAHSAFHPEYKPMIIAAAHNYVEMVSLLLSYGVNINESRMCDGCSPLSVAAYFGFIDMVAFLLSKGADAAQRSKEGLIAYDYAMMEGHEEIAKRLSKAIALNQYSSFEQKEIPSAENSPNVSITVSHIKNTDGLVSLVQQENVRAVFAWKCLVYLGGISGVGCFLIGLGTANPVLIGIGGGLLTGAGLGLVTYSRFFKRHGVNDMSISEAQISGNLPEDHFAYSL